VPEGMPLVRVFLTGNRRAQDSRMLPWLRRSAHRIRSHRDRRRLVVADIKMSLHGIGDGLAYPGGNTESDSYTSKARMGLPCVLRPVLREVCRWWDTARFADTSRCPRMTGIASHVMVRQD
jgi:hypothetical protein